MNAQFSPDFRSVILSDGEQLTHNVAQAAVLMAMHNLARTGCREMGEDYILVEAELEMRQVGIQHIFRCYQDRRRVPHPSIGRLIDRGSTPRSWRWLANI